MPRNRFIMKFQDNPFFKQKLAKTGIPEAVAFSVHNNRVLFRCIGERWRIHLFENNVHTDVYRVLQQVVYRNPRYIFKTILICRYGPGVFRQFFLWWRFSLWKAAPLGFIGLLQGFSTCRPWINFWWFTARYYWNRVCFASWTLQRKCW